MPNKHNDERPTDYYLDYENADLWAKELERVGGQASEAYPPNYIDTEEFLTLERAVERACELAKQHQCPVGIYQRLGIKPILDEDYGDYYWRWNDTDQIADVHPDG